MIRRISLLSMSLLVIPMMAAAQSMMWQAVHFPQNAWPSNGSCNLKQGSITVTLHKFYADVEEEATIAPTGTCDYGDPQSLEITGTFTLSEGSALRSMLLWNGTQMLKAKLRETAKADN